MSYKPSKGPGSIHGWSTTASNRGLPRGWSTHRTGVGTYTVQKDRDGLVWGARLVFWAVLVCVLLALAASAHAGPAVEPFVGYTHVSDIARGPPLRQPSPGCEPTTDWLGAGVTLEWPRTQVDFAHGIKTRDFWCGAPYRQSAESGTLASVRYYFLRGHK